MNNSIIANNTSNTYTLENIQANSTISVEFVVIDAIVDNEVLKARIYPNPSKGQITIELNNAENKSMQIEVRDVLGKLILTEMQTIISKNTIDLTSQNPGIYNLMIKIDNQISNFKIMIE